jgi:hypothetical protein
MKFLIKNKHGHTDPVSDDVESTVIKERKKLTASQLDRYYRATKVWFHADTATFEFEDVHV